MQKSKARRKAAKKRRKTKQKHHLQDPSRLLQSHRLTT